MLGKDIEGFWERKKYKNLDFILFYWKTVFCEGVIFEIEKGSHKIR